MTCAGRSQRCGRLLDLLRTGKYHQSKSEAVAHVVQLAGRRAQSRVVVHKADGTVEEEYAHGGVERHGEEPNVQPLDTKRYRVNPRMPVDQLSEVLDVRLPSTEWDTVGGLLLGTLGHLPVQGEHVELENLRFTATRIHGRRISEILVEQLDPNEPRHAVS